MQKMTGYSENVAFFGGLLSLSMYKLVRLYLLGRGTDLPRDLECVGSVETLYVSPVKGCRAVQVPSADCSYVLEKDGVRDRHWFVGGEEHSFVVDLNEAPSLALVEQTIVDGGLVLDAPGMRTLRLSADPPQSEQIVKFKFHKYDVGGLDCGNEASKWFSEFLQRDVRLYYFAFKSEKDEIWRNMTASEKATRELYFFPNAQDQPKDVFMVTTQQSLKELNQHLRKPVKMRNMRPNIVVDGQRSFDEDDWEELYIGNVTFKTVKLCGRCIRTTVDTDKGVKDPVMEPLKTLRAIRTLPEEINPVFGIYHISTSSGRIHVGDKVYALRKSQQKNYLF